jgi:hypothetical protein
MNELCPCARAAQGLLIAIRHLKGGEGNANAKEIAGNQ